jgi:hypothetical protein
MPVWARDSLHKLPQGGTDGKSHKTAVVSESVRIVKEEGRTVDHRQYGPCTNGLDPDV